MKKIYVLLCCCALWGCETNSERATVNYQKGEKFFEKQEYEVSLYYFEMIPEDNPLYPKAQKKIADIRKIHSELKEAARAETDVSNVTVVAQSFSLDKSGRIPLHKIKLHNASRHVLNAVTVEITYLDGIGNPVDVLTCSFEAAVYAYGEDSFPDIRPGMVKRPFTECQVRVVEADFK